MKVRTEQWKLLLSSALGAAIVAIPWVSKPTMFVLLAFLYAIVIRLILSLVIVLWSLIKGIAPRLGWVCPIPISMVVLAWMFVRYGAYGAQMRLARWGEAVTAGLERGFELWLLLLVIPLLIGLGTLEVKALRKSEAGGGTSH